MKSLILALLVASVAAEQKREAEPSPGIGSPLLYPSSGAIGYGLGSHLGYGLGSGLGYGFGSGLGYGLGSGVGYGYGHLGYPYTALSHTLHKRDASPEPSLAHAGLGLGGLYGVYGIGTGLSTGLGTGLGYGYGIGSGLSTGLGYGYGIGSGLSSGLGYGYGVGHLPYHHLGKRDADPGFFPGVVGHGASYGYGSSALHPGFGRSFVYNQGVVAPFYG